MEVIFDRVDRLVGDWMKIYGVFLLRISLAIIFFWFGILKFFPGLSPAEDLAVKTITWLTGGLIGGRTILIGLATWECLIGIGLLLRVCLRATLLLLFAQMLGTFLPLVLYPSQTFTAFPFAPTLEGQYIIKNLVLITAGIVIGSTVRQKSKSLT